jgi:clan AA aspartic protease
MKMGTVKAEITLKKLSDMTCASKGIIPEADIHTATVQATVDTGSMTLIINEKLRERLDLSAEDRKFVRVADGRRVECVLTEPVKIYWKDRSTIEQAVVLPEGPEALLGVTPLEVMDLMVDPVNLDLVPAHGPDWAEWVVHHSWA